MLKELFLYHTTSCNPVYRQLGYLKEIIAIDARYSRVKKVWQSHLNNSQQHIKQTTLQLNRHRKVIILGSGVLLDVPLTFLSENFDEVVLVDIIHLNKVKRIANQYDNVSFYEVDITGVVEKAFNYQQGEILPTGQPVIPGYDHETDLVISLNLFSQLPVTLKKWLAKKQGVDSGLLDAWSMQLILSHLECLSRLSCPVLLIGDMRHRYFKGDELVAEECFIENTELPSPGESWLWDVSPQGELPGRLTMQSEVGAWLLNT